TGCREKSSAAETVPTAVKLKTVELSTPNHGVRYSANIEPQKQVELAFKVNGYVERIMQARGVDGRLRDVQAGDRVSQGAELARVQPNEYAVKVKQAESSVAEAKSSLDSGKAQLAEAQSSVASGKAQVAEAATAREKARLDWERAKTLFASQSMTKTDYDAAQAQFDAAEAKHAAAQAQLAMLEAKARSAGAQIEVLNARISNSEARSSEAAIPLRDTALRAPLSGIVLSRSVETGALVSPGKAGFVIADLSSVKAVFGVPDLTVNKLKLGSTLMVTTESLPGREFQGQITSIAPAADPKSRVFEIEVTIRNPQQLLKSGMIASLEVTAATPVPPVTVVPVSAVVRARNQAEQYAVFVVEERGGKQIARVRNVKLGEALGNTIVVLEGLSAGERVITTGATQTL
ncbi:MAG TPA: efflux RND transporter periplasmic adaptor subunit, partial [Roseiflexaceae bacterium]|nr:efflux RND transporter periplasmic adaptor subunit [Roseiflexaceae bacterium]